MQVVATPAAKGGERDVGGSHKRSKGNGLHACGGGAALVNTNLASAVGGGMGAFVAGAAMAGAALGLLMAQQGSGRAGGGILGLDLLGSPAALAGAAEAAVAGQGQGVVSEGAGEEDMSQRARRRGRTRRWGSATRKTTAFCDSFGATSSHLRCKWRKSSVSAT